MNARAAAALAAALLVAAPAAAAPRLPRGFRERIVTRALDSPVSMALAPDGRVFVCEQAGAIRVVRRGRLLARPFWTAPAHAEVEAGLLGLAFDPAFADNGRVVVSYVARDPARIVVVRLQALGDTAAPAPLDTLLETPPLTSPLHMGGALRFAPDGRLFVSVGANQQDDLAQSMASVFGKVLRMEADGALPADDPFLATTHGPARFIWSLGYRNPFAMDVNRAGRLFVNDVGEHDWEEVCDATRASNQGWPLVEGAGAGSGFAAPRLAYSHAEGCAITGGAFYEPDADGFPAEWRGRYLFAEFCAGEIRWLDPAAGDSARVFGRTRAAGPVDLRVAGGGALWVLARGDANVVGQAHLPGGTLSRIEWRGGREKGGRSRAAAVSIPGGP